MNKQISLASGSRLAELQEEYRGVKQDFAMKVGSFIDKYINIERIYPIKIKGDMVYTVKLKGKPSDFNLNTKINLNPNSSVYYYGATVGDVENSIVLTLNAKVNNEKKFKIAEFSPIIGHLKNTAICSTSL